MCGIAGVYHTGGQEPSVESLVRMSRAIAHRGPDGERFLIDGGLGLAHRHLRIIDLTDAARQPMGNEDGTVWIVLNGEVYNYIELRPELEARGHVFRSHSDTEVVIHAYEEWGVDCLDRFNGMFAFALWDSRLRRLFVARDRLGVKPLYFHWRDGTLRFASEIKALLQEPGFDVRPELPAIAEYMNAMFTSGVHTWFEGIERLLPGHYLLANPEGLVVRRWWDVPAHEDEPGEHTEQFYVSEARALLEDSVRLRRRSDVPLGAHLSGGLDSSAVVALNSLQLRASGETLRTFSGAFAEGVAYDERQYIRDVVRLYGTRHHETLPVADDFPRLLDRMTYHMDEPAAGPGLLLQYRVCELTHDAGVVVINGGQGGDEEWGGYFGYVPPYMTMLARAALRSPESAGELALDALRLVSRAPGRRAVLKALTGRRSGRLTSSASPGAWAGPRMLDSPNLFEERAAPELEGLEGRSLLGAAMYRDLRQYLPALLHVEDRMSMAFSLESRAPLLDYRLVEHAARTPSLLKLKGLDLKHVFREAVKDLLPPSVFRRVDKMGMPTPIGPWFRGSLAGWVRDSIRDSGEVVGEVLDARYVNTALEHHLLGRADRSLDIWRVLSVASWWRLFMHGSRLLGPLDASPLDADVIRPGTVEASQVG